VACDFFVVITATFRTLSVFVYERAPDNGIALQALDGAHVDGVAFSNITMAGVRRPILILLNARGRGQNPPVPGSIENVSFNNIVARGAVNTSSVRGIPGAKVRRVSFSNITITMDGGDLEPKGLEMGARSAYGFYSQHAEGMALSNFFVRWQKEDRRPAMVFADVKDLTVDGFRTDTVAGASPVVWLNNVVDAFVRGSSTAAAQTFLRVSGADSQGIMVMGNDLTRAGKSVEIVDAPKTAVQEAGNTVGPAGQH
jgi:hypothetical protein